MDTGTVSVVDRVAVGTAVVETVVVAGSIVAVDIAGLGLVVVASFNTLSTLHNTRSIQCVYVV